MPLTMIWRNATAFPVECEALRPDMLRAFGAAEIARLPLRLGTVPAELGDLFQIAGDPADGRVVVEGDLSVVRRLGAGMASGELVVRGQVGPLLGVGMVGGAIVVEGSAGDWAGADLRGGQIRIVGQAGDHLGSALPGSRLGMRGGVILVEGSIGSGAGLAMRRGLIAVSGAAGDDLGHGLIAGTIAVFGPVARRPGAAMKRGTLLFCGPQPPLLPPGFRFACTQRPPFVAIYLRWLRDHGFPVPTEAGSRPFQRYNGDVLEQGQGEILVSQAAASPGAS